MVHNNTLGDIGALAFTTQKFYRINGGSTQLKGVNSDIVIPDRYSFIDVGERDLENPLPWDEITPADYTLWSGELDYTYVITNSKNRIENNPLFQLIKENAEWIKDNRDDVSTSLNYQEFKKEQESNEMEIKRFDQLSDYENQLQFASLPYELEVIKQDSILKEKRERWHQNLKKDLYVEEALNVLTDLRVSQNINKKSLTAIKN
jgi:carboxyl-terminal processing protease